MMIKLMFHVEELHLKCKQHHEFDIVLVKHREDDEDLTLFVILLRVSFDVMNVLKEFDQ